MINDISDCKTTTLFTGYGAYDRAFYYIDEVRVELAPNGIESSENTYLELNISPNPAKDMILVSIENVNQNTIQLYDQTGKEVTNLVSITFGNEIEFLVDISQLSSG